MTKKNLTKTFSMRMSPNMNYQLDSICDWYGENRSDVMKKALFYLYMQERFERINHDPSFLLNKECAPNPNIK